MKNKFLRNVVIICSLTFLAGLNCATSMLGEMKMPFQTYRISDNECTIVAYFGNETNLVIPDVIHNKKVAGIEEGVFQGKNLTSVIISENVKKIGKDAFRNNRLTSVKISGSVTSIESDAFRNNRITSVVIPDSVKQIGENAFRDNSLSNITIGSNVENIGSFAFYNNQLASVTIPGSVRIIDDYAFGSNPLNSIVINGKSDSANLNVKLRNDVSVTVPGNIMLITSNSLGVFSKAYAANNRRPGTYTKKDDNILYNGSALPKPAVITTGNNAWLTKINGQAPVLYCFDFSKDRSVSNWQTRSSLESLALKRLPYSASVTDFYQGSFYLPPGEHTIELIYFTGQRFSTIVKVLDKQELEENNTYRVTADAVSNGRRVIFKITQAN